MITLTNLHGRIPASEYDAINKMADRINTHRARHRTRQAYYDGTSGLKDLGISIPPSLRNLEAALGWPAIAVDSLAKRVQMEGFVLPSGDLTTYGVDYIVEANQVTIESSQSTKSSLLQGCAFIATFRGDVTAGEPEAVIQAFPATQATGLWKKTSRSLGAALLILSEDWQGPNRVLAVFPHVVYLFERGQSGWSIYPQANTLGRVSVHLHPFNPSLDRPFGKSHLSRDMMNITDSAMRAVARAEVGAEFFVAPQRFLLGAEEEAFLDENGEPKAAWDLMMGRILALPYNEDNEVMPEVGTFQQMSMQPHSDQLRTYSGLFAAAAGVPVSTLGVIHDNPASAEGVNAVRDDLIINAELAARTFTPAWTGAVRDAAQIANNSLVPIEDLKRLAVRWRDPQTVSKSQAADATLKLVSSGVIPADSDVALEMVGMSEADIMRIKAHRAQAGAADKLTQIMNRARPAATEAPVADEEV